MTRILIYEYLERTYNGSKTFSKYAKLLFEIQTNAIAIDLLYFKYVRQMYISNDTP